MASLSTRVGRKRPRALLACVSCIGLAIAAAGSLAAATPEPTAAGGTTRWLTYLDQAAAGGFSGVVLVARGSEILVHEARGFADFELSVPLDVDHILRIGSLTKPITASVVLRLVERGELDLQASICDGLAPCPRTWQPITLHHLLSHTSGLPEYFGDLEAVPVEDTASEVRRLLERLGDRPEIEQPPGTEYAYRNFNYVLLGMLLEERTASPWEEVLTREVFGPLGLTTLRYDDVWSVVAGRAHGYVREGSSLRNIEYDDHAAYAAGGLAGRAHDLFVWFRALADGRIVGEPLLTKAFTPNLGGYGYGWARRAYFDRPIAVHTGGIDGFSSVLMHDRSSDLLIVVLSNVSSDNAILRACDLLQLTLEPSATVDVAARETLEPRARCAVPAAD